MNDREEFIRGYIECALWSGVEPPVGHPMHDRDKLYDLPAENIDADTMARMVADAGNFYDAHEGLFGARNGASRGGHDLWLTRNGHGAGYWDGDWPEPAASILTDAAKVLGEYTLYANEDGTIQGE